MTTENNEDDILVDVQNGEGTDTPAAPKTPEDEGLEFLKAQVADARKAQETARLAREEADRRAQHAANEARQAREEAQRFRTEATDGRMHTVVAAIDSVTREAEMAQAKLEKAAQDGDYKALALAQREISRAEARLVQLDNNKAALEYEAANPRVEQPVQQPIQPADPVDRYAASLTPSSARWVREHRDVVLPNGGPSPKLLAAHYDAVAAGIQPDTDAYFSHLDQKMGHGDPVVQDRSNDGSRVVDITERRQPAVSAPVSRDAPGVPTSATRVRLTPEQREAAEASGISDLEYARQLMAIRREQGLSH